MNRKHIILVRQLINMSRRYIGNELIMARNLPDPRDHERVLLKVERELAQLEDLEQVINKLDQELP